MARDERDHRVRLSRLLLPPLALSDMLSEGADEAAKAGRDLGLTQGDIGVVILVAISTFALTTALGSHGFGGGLSALVQWVAPLMVGCYIGRRYVIAAWVMLRLGRRAGPFIVMPEERDGQPGWGIFDQRKHETLAWRAARGEASTLARHLNRALAARDETSDAWWGE